MSCDKCEYDCESAGHLEEHVRTTHKASECLNCTFTADEDTVLKDHQSDCYIYKENLAKNKATFSTPVKVAKDDINAVENEDAAEKSLIESKEELTVICGVCNTAFYNVADCEKHGHPPLQVF